jgi:hypothetical protein
MIPPNVFNLIDSFLRAVLIVFAYGLVVKLVRAAIGV